MRVNAQVAQGKLVLDAMMRDRFDEFVRKNEPSLISAARLLCGSDHDAVDLVQDTFEYALKHFTHLRLEGRERHWLGMVLKNRFIDGYRRKSKLIPQELSDDLVDEGKAGEPGVWEQVTPAMLQMAIDLLLPSDRHIYDLRYVRGLSYRQIGTALGIPSNTVGTTLLRIRKQLKQSLTKALGVEE